MAITPTIGAIERRSDGSIKINWTNGETYDNVYIYRWSNSNAGETPVLQLAVVDGTSTSYIDRTCATDMRYAWAIRGIIDSVFSEQSAWTDSVDMTPTGCGWSGNAILSSANAVTLQIRNLSFTGNTLEVRRQNIATGVWDTLVSVSGNKVTTYTDNTVVAGNTYAWQVRNAYISGGVALYSGWTSSSNAVTITAAVPSAPSILSGTNAVKATDVSSQMAWQHNPTDNSAQSAYEVSYRIALPGGSYGAATTTGKITSAESVYDFVVNNAYADGTKVKWQVRTWGLHATPSAYSAETEFSILKTPSIVVSTPATDLTELTALPLVIAWEYGDSDYAEQSAVDIIVETADGQNEYSMTITGTDTAITVPVDDFIPLNGTTYKISLFARSSGGLACSAVRYFSTDYVAPAVPSADITAYESSVSLTVHQGTQTGGMPATEYLSVRRIYKDVAELVCSNMADGGSCLDLLPQMGVPVTFRVFAHAMYGASSYHDYTITLPAEGRHYWNFGDSYLDTAYLANNASSSTDNTDNGEYFVTAGRTSPLFGSGRLRDKTLQVSGTVRIEEDIAALEAFAEWGKPCWFRDPFGRKYYVHADVGSGYGTGPRTEEYTVSMRRVAQ